MRPFILVLNQRENISFQDFASTKQFLLVDVLVCVHVHVHTHTHTHTHTHRGFVFILIIL